MFDLVHELPYACTTWSGDSRGPAVEIDITDLVLAEKASLYVNAVEASEIAAHFGFLTPAAQEEKLAELAAEKASLLERVAWLEENLSVPLATVIDLVEERAKRRPVAVAQEPVA